MEARQVSHPAARVAVGYALWVLANVVVVAFNIGDGGVNSHLALLFSGFPSSLPSLALQHASLAAVLVAGALGAVQWSLVAWLVTKALRTGRGRHGA
jgi:hypothetical protein